MNPDFVDLLRAFGAAEVRFLIVGAYALAFHARPRATGDLDIWVEPSDENSDRVMRALRDFGAPLHEVGAQDFSTPGTVFQIGLPPRRIDILTALTGLSFKEAWDDRLSHRIESLEVCFLGKTSFKKNKRALGRPRDIADLEAIEASEDS